MIRVLIADDHPIVRDGLIAVLAADPDVEVVGQAGGGREAVTLAGRLSPDVVLLDLRMPAGDGVAAITALRAGSRDTPRILVLTTYDTDDDIRRALVAGADGYLLKDTPRADLLDAVHQLAAGHPVLTPEVLRAVTRAPSPGGPAADCPRARRAARGGRGWHEPGGRRAAVHQRGHLQDPPGPRLRQARRRRPRRRRPRRL